jgi:hypothetical protein
MATYIVTNCVNSNETLIVDYKIGGLSPGQTVYVSTENYTGCYSIQEETAQLATVSVDMFYGNCLECFLAQQFVFEIRNCNSDTSVFTLPNDYGFQINVFYGVITEKETQCFEFLGVTQNQTSGKEAPTPTNEFDGCNRCLFEGAVAVRNSSANYQQLNEITRQNYTNIINRAAVS